MSGILGKKEGMTQVFGPDGKVIPVTVVSAGPCTVLEVLPERSALKLGFGEVKEDKLKKPRRGYFAKLGLPPCRVTREIPWKDPDSVKPGARLDVSIFRSGDFVDVSGISKGRGFAGMIKRWNASRWPMSHGHPEHRRTGALSSSATPGRVVKGKNMPGHYGYERVTVQNLQVVAVRPEDNVLLLKGAVPGPTGGLLLIRGALKKKSAAEQEKD